jgi:hypothetical protein
MAGDQSMHADINANAASDGPIPKMARQALKNDDWVVQYKRKREELELLEREEDIKSNFYTVSTPFLDLFYSTSTPLVYD